MNKFSTHSNIKSQYIIIVSKTNMGINGSGRALTDTQVICYAFDGKLMSYSNLENILFYSIISDGVKNKDQLSYKVRENFIDSLRLNRILGLFTHLQQPSHITPQNLHNLNTFSIL